MIFKNYFEQLQLVTLRLFMVRYIISTNTAVWVINPLIDGHPLESATQLPNIFETALNAEGFAIT